MANPSTTARGRGEVQSRTVSVSCGDCLKLKLPWATPKRNNNNSNKHRGSASIYDATASFCLHETKQRRPGRVVYKYDALSYAQNFYDGEDDQEYFSHGFSSRYAVSASKLSSYSYACG